MALGHSLAIVLNSARSRKFLLNTAQRRTPYMWGRSSPILGERAFWRNLSSVCTDAIDRQTLGECEWDPCPYENRSYGSEGLDTAEFRL